MGLSVEDFKNITDNYRRVYKDYSEVNARQYLLGGIPGTTPVTVMENGKPKTVTWKDTSNRTVRTDTFTWSTTSLVETRVLVSGYRLTLTTDLTKSPPETVYSNLSK